MSEENFSALPIGQRAWLALIDTVSQTDDRLERHFLELKSDVDLNESSGRAKVAKFVLGAAHRDPARAEPYFDGRAVMLLGVGKGAATGIRGFEAHELERAVAKFTGAAGPRWDFVRIEVADDRDVVAIIVDPPDGRVWPCLNDGHGLTDGVVYLRADGATRPAKGSELQAVLARSLKTAMGSGEFTVSVLEPAYRALYS